MKINWKTILIIILAIVLVCIAFLGGWSTMLSYISSAFPGLSTGAVALIGVAVVSALALGIVLLTLCHPEWLQEIIDLIGSAANTLSDSLNNFVAGATKSWLMPVLALGAFFGTAYLLLRSGSTKEVHDD